MYADPKLFMMPLVALVIICGLWRAEMAADHGVAPAHTGTVRLQPEDGIRLAAATVGVAGSLEAETSGQASAGN
jgi:hypothetical protein